MKFKFSSVSIRNWFSRKPCRVFCEKYTPLLSFIKLRLIPNPAISTGYFLNFAQFVWKLWNFSFLSQSGPDHLQPPACPTGQNPTVSIFLIYGYKWKKYSKFVMNNHIAKNILHFIFFISDKGNVTLKKGINSNISSEINNNQKICENKTPNQGLWKKTFET